MDNMVLVYEGDKLNDTTNKSIHKGVKCQKTWLSLLRMTLISPLFFPKHCKPRDLKWSRFWMAKSLKSAWERLSPVLLCLICICRMWMDQPDSTKVIPTSRLVNPG